MKSVFLLSLGFSAFTSLLFGQDIVSGTQQQLLSPDNNYVFNFYQKRIDSHRTQMCYTVDYLGKQVIAESELGVQIENDLFENALAVPNDSCKEWSQNFIYLDTERGSHDEVWKPVYGERAEIRDCYNSMTISFSKSGKKKEEVPYGYPRNRTYYMNIEVRAYNEGVAFRYVFPETTNGMFLHIVDENTQFSMPDGTMAYYEKWAQGPYSFLPLKDWTSECERPLTLQLPDGKLVALGEAALVDFVRTKFVLDPHKASTLKTNLYASADVITHYSMPWRVIRIAPDAATLANGNDIVLNLNEPCKLASTQWIKPGKCFRCCSLTQKDGLEAIDFAAERGLQYVEFDAGWYGREFMKSSDATTVDEKKDLDFKVLCDYARSKGIGIIVYVNQRALSQQLDDILPLYKKWGIAGLKFGFVQVGNQYWTTWLHEAIRKCADYQMLIDIHDEYRPTGYSRTYPNLMTQEGIRGNEEMPDAAHNTTLPFTRYLAGAGDYTLCYYSGKIKNTHAHQLAMAAVYYSPLQFLYWYDKPNQYKGEAELEFWKHIPAVWDDTQYLQGEIGKWAVVARRSGDTWFMGVLNGMDSREVSVPTTFLAKGTKYMATIYEDDPALQTTTKVKVSTRKVKSGETLKFKLQGSGGAAVEFSPL